MPADISRRAALAFVAAVAAALSTAVGAATTLVSFTIDDGFPGTGPGVFSDAATTGTTAYADYRIGELPLNWCVDAEPFWPGNLFIRLNRKLDGETFRLVRFDPAVKTKTVGQAFTMPVRMEFKTQ